MISPRPLISIIIPTLNEGSWLRKTVQSVVKENDGYSLEIIIVDDGSTDGSCEQIQSFSPTNVKIKLLAVKDYGVARARNHGACAASGDILAFIDAHVLPESNWLKELITTLRNPSVGIAGLAVRSWQEPQNIGYGYVFLDENLRPGWISKKSDNAFETPSVVGCCMSMTQDFFHSIGGFDEGTRRWGIEDIEISLRTWFLGYKCIVSPRVTISHYFKSHDTRSYNVSWEQYDVNLIRCVLTYFSKDNRDSIFGSIRRRPNFATSLRTVVNDPKYWERRKELKAKFVYDDQWFLTKFCEELKPFIHRLSQFNKHKHNLPERSQLW